MLRACVRGPNNCRIRPQAEIVFRGCPKSLLTRESFFVLSPPHNPHSSHFLLPHLPKWLMLRRAKAQRTSPVSTNIYSILSCLSLTRLFSPVDFMMGGVSAVGSVLVQIGFVQLTHLPLGCCKNQCRPHRAYQAPGPESG